MQHTPALCLDLVGAMPALLLNSLNAILACLYDPRECLNCGIPMITQPSMFPPSTLSPVTPHCFSSLAHTTQTMQTIQTIKARHCRHARCTDEFDQGTEVGWLSS